MAILENVSTNGPLDASADGQTIFSVPIGRLGLFPRVLVGGACGAIGFFIAFFFSIFAVVIFDSVTGRSIQNLYISYRYIAAPIGVLAMLVCQAYLITSWARRRFSGAQ